MLVFSRIHTINAFFNWDISIVQPYPQRIYRFITILILLDSWFCVFWNLIFHQNIQWRVKNLSRRAIFIHINIKIFILKYFNISNYFTILSSGYTAEYIAPIRRTQKNGPKRVNYYCLYNYMWILKLFSKWLNFVEGKDKMPYYDL